MAEHTNISWCDHTFNPWIGCSRVSPACDGCYACALMGEEGRLKRAAWGGPGKGVGTRSRTSASYWRQPLAWDRKAAAAGKLTFVFCASLADVFDNAVPPDWRRDLFDLIRATPHLTWLLLTKRPQNIVKLFDQAENLSLLAAGGLKTMPRPWPRNAAIGCTVVTPGEARRDIPHLKQAKRLLNPAFAFVSMEPLLAGVDLTETDANQLMLITGLDWVIAGGETDQGGHQARPSRPEWFRSLRDQCAEAGVPFHFKQWGSWHADALAYTDAQRRCPPPTMKIGARRAGRLLDGLLHDARPVQW